MTFIDLNMSYFVVIFVLFTLILLQFFRVSFGNNNVKKKHNAPSLSATKTLAKIYDVGG